ncbi:hypothetical protein GWI33_021071 [Rhynchophorus ferrugineus]|uniref:Uncharacterized protein n=1 Tax=Rhynchophorus ferrugineus TaxID=354439 RepID=A0A834HT99_RHYFE|nr:hypothetical protein GWI33_021071 [Rhynchophorus ferrugineus]
MFQLKESQSQELKDNITSPIARFSVNNLEPGAQYQAVMFAYNSKGRSEPVILQASTLRLPEKQLTAERDMQKTSFKFTPLMSIIIGVVAALLIVLLVVILVLRLQCSQSGDHIRKQQQRQKNAVVTGANLEHRGSGSGATLSDKGERLIKGTVVESPKRERPELPGPASIMPPYSASCTLPRQPPQQWQYGPVNHLPPGLYPVGYRNATMTQQRLRSTQTREPPIPLQPMTGSNEEEPSPETPLMANKRESTGTHSWEIYWPRSQRGSHPLIGVATAEAPLHCRDFRTLIGGNKQSWAWNLNNNRLYHDFGVIPSQPYPIFKGGEREYVAANKITVILNMDAGQLSFAVNGTNLGVAFRGLQGKVLYPVINTVSQFCDISMRYTGALKPGPPSLKAICRIAIREGLRPYSIDIPDMLISFNIPRHLAYYVGTTGSVML